MRVVPCIALVAATVIGCGEDLGTCNMDAATMVVYASDGTPYYPGQGLVEFGCAEGVCHSEIAEFASRKGAPHGVNFDVGPLTAQSTAADLSMLRDGLAAVHDRADGIWHQIVDGTMPPGAAGERPDQRWKRADGSAAGLPGLSTDKGKATVRNWLACGAPVVAGTTGAPAEAKQMGAIVAPLKVAPSGVPPTFNTVFDTVFAQCVTCHMPSGAYAALGLNMTTKSAAYASLVDKAPYTGGSPGVCGNVGTKLIVPGNCKDSLVYQKLHPHPPCGMQMPLGSSLSDAAIQTLCEWIDAGAKM